MKLNIGARDLTTELDSATWEVHDQEESLHHLFERSDLLAAWTAYQARRPLLLRGEPGTGKSQYARALAHLLGWAFVSEVVHGGLELADLHYRYDAIGRLGEAQSLAWRGLARSASGTPDRAADQVPDVEALLDHARFIRPGCFWWAFAWESAASAFPTRDEAERVQPWSPPGWDPDRDGVVLLLDEIDKADPDLPNGLLQTLGDLEFTVPHVHRRIQGHPDRLLLVITTNEERDLPRALVRRCLSHTLRMGQEVDWFVRRGRLHFGDAIHDDAYRRAAELLLEDRGRLTTYPPGLAEYLDLLRALVQVDRDGQADLLETISGFAYAKERGDRG